MAAVHVDDVADRHEREERDADRQDQLHERQPDAAEPEDSKQRSSISSDEEAVVLEVQQRRDRERDAAGHRQCACASPRSGATPRSRRAARAALTPASSHTKCHVPPRVEHVARADHEELPGQGFRGSAASGPGRPGRRRSRSRSWGRASTQNPSAPRPRARGWRVRAPRAAASRKRARPGSSPSVERSPVGGRRPRVAPLEAAEQVGAGGVEQVVAVEVAGERVDQRQSGAGPVGHRHRHGPVQLDHRLGVAAARAP